jgi:hypothetical protein
MVCNEDHLRGVQMSMAKYFHRVNGGTPLHNAAYQSLVHDMNHDFDAANAEPLSKAAQIRLIDEMIKKIENDPSIPENLKHHDSKGRGSRLGYVERLRREQERVRTGLNEKGEPLSEAQKNKTSHFLACMSYQENAEKLAPAQDAFVENYARSTGMSMEDAQKKFNAVVDQPGNFSRESGIKEGWKEKMAFAGLPSEQQIAFSQAGRIRRAVAIMERDRQDKISQLPTRDFREAATHTYSFTADKTVIQCEICGQFGHTGDNCMNEKEAEEKEALVTAINEIEENGKWDAYEREYEDIRSELPMLRQLQDPSEYDGAVARLDHIDREFARRDERIDTLGKAIDAHDANMATKADAYVEDPDVLASDEIARLTYNKETGVLIKEDKDPSKPFDAYRVSQKTMSDFRKMAKAEGADKAWNTLIANEPAHRFENDADLDAALDQHKCPTCGRWANLNSGHKCPVTGGPTEQNNAALFKDRMAATGRDKVNRPAGVDAMGRKNPAQQFDDPDNGRTVVGNVGNHTKPGKVLQDAEFGYPTVGSYDVRFNDGNVSGEYAVWRNPSAAGGPSHVISFKENGAVSSTGVLKCDCAVYARNHDCKHVRMAQGQISKQYNNLLTRAGGSLGEAPDGIHAGGRADGVVEDRENIRSRTDIDVLIAERRELAENKTDEFVGYQENLLAASQPGFVAATDNNGNTIGMPTEFVDDSDGFGAADGNSEKYIQLNDTTQVHNYLKRKTKDFRSKEGNGRGSIAINHDSDGGMWLYPATRRAQSKYTKEHDLKRLAEQFKVDPRTLDPKRGLYIPNDAASRLEACQTITDKESTVTGPRAIYLPTEETMKLATTRSVVGRHYEPK